ncbi:MAG: hypothetical protein B6U76_00850 [Desulfurococcales archaeon ex4484_217_2]|nr:MAG: hypothetical protein B6U76_00850 [Desulfurococcales archaeon ex4484_217_2]
MDKTIQERLSVKKKAKYPYKEKLEEVRIKAEDTKKKVSIETKTITGIKYFKDIIHPKPKIKINITKEFVVKPQHLMIKIPKLISLQKPKMTISFTRYIAKEHHPTYHLRIPLLKTITKQKFLVKINTSYAERLKKTRIYILTEHHVLPKPKITVNINPNIAFKEEAVLKKVLTPGSGRPSSGNELNIPDDVIDIHSRSTCTSFTSIIPEGPIYIVVDDALSLHEYIAELCALTLRIFLGGLPSVRDLQSEMDFRARLMDQDRLIIIEETSPLQKVKSKTKSQEDLKSLKTFKVLAKEYDKSRAFRYIILPVKRKALDDVIDFLLEDSELGIYVHQLLGYIASESITVIKTLLATYGFPEPLEVMELKFRRADRRDGKFGFKITIDLKNTFLRTLEIIRRKLSAKINPTHWPRPSKEYESWLHQTLKWFIMYHLISRNLVTEEKIEFEKTLTGEIIPDVYVESFLGKHLAVEIETLYGTGDPIIRVNEKLRKYQEEAKIPGLKLWMVIPNPQALLFNNQLLRLEKAYRENGLDVDFYILDVAGYGHQLIYKKKAKPGLLKLRDVIKWLKTLQ